MFSENNVITRPQEEAKTQKPLLLLCERSAISSNIQSWLTLCGFPVETASCAESIPKGKITRHLFFVDSYKQSVIRKLQNIQKSEGKTKSLSGRISNFFKYRCFINREANKLLANWICEQEKLIHLTKRIGSPNFLVVHSERFDQIDCQVFRFIKEDWRFKQSEFIPFQRIHSNIDPTSPECKLNFKLSLLIEAEEITRHLNELEHLSNIKMLNYSF